MNETEIAVMSGLAKIREADVRVVPMEVTKLEDLEEKYRMACWLLRDAADTLACMDGANYPLISIMQFLEENAK